MDRSSATIVFAASWLLCALAIASVACEPAGQIVVEMRNDMDRVVRVRIPEVGRFQDTQTSVERPATATPYTKETSMVIDETLQPGEAKTVTLHLFGSHVGPARAYSDAEIVFCEQFGGKYVSGNSTQRWELVIRRGPLDCEQRKPWH